jgi:tRNA G18 (ribose-2'-O)-methylase SpoU
MELREDPRNVADVYKYWTEDAIKADLRTKHNNFSALVTNKHHDFNIGTVIRNANAFCAKEVIVHGRKKYDKRGTVGAHLYTTMKHVRFMAFGQEQTGLEPEMLKLCKHLVYIKQYGSVRSLNVGCASAIAMYDYCQKMCAGS